MLVQPCQPALSPATLNVVFEREMVASLVLELFVKMYRFKYI